MKEIYYFSIIILILCLIFIGCNPVIPEPEPEPELDYIKIEPQYAEIKAGDSIDLLVKGFSEDGQEVDLIEDKIFWSKCCPSGELDPSVGYITTFTSARSSSGVMHIYCDYEGLKDTGRVKIIGR
ncbi:hypothetical protein ES703_82375 [subsurface metagenome]